MESTLCCAGGGMRSRIRRCGGSVPTCGSCRGLRIAVRASGERLVGDASLWFLLWNRRRLVQTGPAPSSHHRRRSYGGAETCAAEEQLPDLGEPIFSLRHRLRREVASTNFAANIEAAKQSVVPALQLCLPPAFPPLPRRMRLTLLCTYYRTIVCKAGSKCCAAKVGTPYSVYDRTYHVHRSRIHLADAVSLPIRSSYLVLQRCVQTALTLLSTCTSTGRSPSRWAV